MLHALVHRQRPSTINTDNTKCQWATIQWLSMRFWYIHILKLRLAECAFTSQRPKSTHKYGIAGMSMKSAVDPQCSLFTFCEQHALDKYWHTLTLWSEGYKYPMKHKKFGCTIHPRVRPHGTLTVIFVQSCCSWIRGFLFFGAFSVCAYGNNANMKLNNKASEGYTI